MQSVEGLIRTLLPTCEERLATRIRLEEKTATVMANYAAYLINRLEVGKDGRSVQTAYERCRRKRRSRSVSSVRTLVEGTSEEQAGEAQSEMEVWRVHWRQGDEWRHVGGNRTGSAGGGDEWRLVGGDRGEEWLATRIRLEEESAKIMAEYAAYLINRLEVGKDGQIVCEGDAQNVVWSWRSSSARSSRGRYVRRTRWRSSGGTKYLWA